MKFIRDFSVTLQYEPFSNIPVCPVFESYDDYLQYCKDSGYNSIDHEYYELVHQNSNLDYTVPAKIDDLGCLLIIQLDNIDIFTFCAAPRAQETKSWWKRIKRWFWLNFTI